MLSRNEYEKAIAETRDERMGWWREARFGMFVHYGLYSQVGRNEWVMACENIPPKEYEKREEFHKALLLQLLIQMVLFSMVQLNNLQYYKSNLKCFEVDFLKI